MNGRDRMTAIVSGERPDRLPIRGISGWGEMIERWKTEGLDIQEDAQLDSSKALGLVDLQGEILLPLDLNMVPAFPIEIIGTDAEYVVLKDEFGVTKKMLCQDFERSGGYKAGAGLMSSMSLWLDFPVKDIKSWKAIYEQRFQPALKGRLPADWDDRIVGIKELAATRWVKLKCFPFLGLFGPMRELMGVERLLYTMVDDPPLIHTIVRDLTAFWLATLNQVIRNGIRIDEILFFEDMCGTKAPIISPAMFEVFLAPGYRHTIGALREMNVMLFTVDTDGNAWEILPAMIRAGINGLHPCEVQAGMDAERLRCNFPGLYLNGGIAKASLTGCHERIEEEMKRRFRIAWDRGRYTPRLDHLAPPDISLGNIRKYAQLYLRLSRQPPD